MRSFAKSYNQYLKELCKSKREVIQKLSNIILSLAPGSKIVMKWGMPVFSYEKETYLGIAAQSAYFSIYIWNFDWKKELSRQIKKFNTGTDCLRFTKLDQIPAELLQSIVEKSLPKNL